MFPWPEWDAYAMGFKSIASLADGDFTSLRSQDFTDVCSAAAAACPDGLPVIGITIIVATGTVHYRFTGEVDAGAAGDSHTDYPGMASSISIPIKGVRDRSSAAEQLTRVSLHPISATGYALAYFGPPARS